MANNGERLKRRDELSRRLAAHFARHPRAYWFEKFLEVDLPGGVLRTVDEALDSRQSRERELIYHYGDRVPGNLRVVTYPVKLSCGLPDPGNPPQRGEGGAALAEQWLKPNRSMERADD
jgi:crotonobetainyl-CoA:carnitine CoA-transferase CaiB-like acyl-CoA transferase